MNTGMRNAMAQRLKRVRVALQFPLADMLAIRIPFGPLKADIGIAKGLTQFGTKHSVSG